MVEGSQEWSHRHITLTAADLGKRTAGESPRRIAGIDSLRGAAVLGMFFAHAARLMPARSQAAKHGLYHWIDVAEPAISACFLFLVGWSLAHSWTRVKSMHEPALTGQWLRGCFRRAGALYVGGVLLFLLHYGANFPDAVVSPDILSVIACGIVVVGACLCAAPLVRWIAVVGFLALALLLESEKISIAGLNAGPGGVVPALAFAFGGAAFRLVEVQSKAAARAVAVGAMTSSLVALALPGPMVLEHVSHYRLADGTLAPIGFWNHTTLSVFVLLGPLVASTLLLNLRPAVAGHVSIAPLRLIGRHALASYIGHLLLLGVVTRSWSLPRGALALVFGVAVLGGLALALSVLLESRGLARWRATLHRTLGVGL